MIHDSGLSPEDTRRAAQSALWTFPAILSSAFIVAWAAEAAQFFISQGLALAVLAWVQVLPEFAVEAAIAWQGPPGLPLMTANLTGALRLLTGLGWPLIWMVFAISRRVRGERGFFARIELEEEHAVEVVGLTPALAYFAWIVLKQSITVVDAAVLATIYAGYLAMLQRIPPREHEDVEDMAFVPRRLVKLPPAGRTFAIAAMFVGGAMLLWIAAEPFLHSMIAVAAVAGIPTFVFIQWVAPCLSEFPEFLTTTYWARGKGKAGMALMNMVSSNVVQWTLLAGMIPVAYSARMGGITPVPLSSHRIELVMTLLQNVLGVVLLANFNFAAHEALGLFALWIVQFAFPGLHVAVCWAYAGWCAFEIASSPFRRDRLRAFPVFVRLWREHAAMRR